MTLSIKSIIGSFVAIFVPTGCVLFYLKQKRKKSRPPVEGIPYNAPPPHWLLGHWKYMFYEDPLEGVRQLTVAQTQGDVLVSSFWLFNNAQIAILDAKLATRIYRLCSSRSGGYSPLIRRHWARLFGETSILFQDGKEWRASRDIIHKAFVPSALADVMQSVWETTFRVESSIHATIDRADEKKMLTHILELTRVIALDVFGKAAFDYDFGCTSDDRLNYAHPIIEAVEFLQIDTTNRLLVNPFSIFSHLYSLPSSSNIANKHHNKVLRDTIRDVMHNRRARNSSERSKRQDLLENALAGSQRFDNVSDTFLSDWLVTSIFGGYDTQSLALFGAIYYLAKHKEWQEACHEEAQRFFDSQNAFDRTTDPSEKFPLIQACFLEALRCYPPVLWVARNSDKAVEILIDNKPVVVPPGVRFLMPFYWIHHNEKNFPRPDEFLPQRWVQKRRGLWEWRTKDNDIGGDVSVGDRNSVLSFAAGGRNCVGRPLAERSSSAILATLLRSIDFELLDPSLELKFKRCASNVVPRTDIPIRVTRRRLEKLRV